MIVRAMKAAVIAGLVLLASASALGAQAPSDSGLAPPQPRDTVTLLLPVAPADSIAQRASGYYVSDADPTGLLQVALVAPGVLKVTDFRRFTCVGHFDGSEFVGVARPASAPPAHEAPGRFELVRFKLVSKSEIIATFSQRRRTWLGRSVTEGPSRTETWTRRRQYDEPSVGSPPPPVPADSLLGLARRVYVEEPPKAIKMVRPDYPKSAQKKGIQGVVMVQVLVGKDGRVVNARIVSSIPELDDYALGAVRQWRFKPARSKGQPVAVWVAVPVQFSLH